MRDDCLPLCVGRLCPSVPPQRHAERKCISIRNEIDSIIQASISSPHRRRRTGRCIGPFEFGCRVWALGLSALLATCLAGPVSDFEEVKDDPWPAWIKALQAPRPTILPTEPPVNSWMGLPKTTTSTLPPPGWSEDCEYIMGLEKRVKRPDLPGASKVKQVWAKDSLAVQLGYGFAGLSPVDYEMDIDDGGIVAWPRAGFGPPLTVSQADRGGDDLPDREFWLHAMQLRMPSEHTVDGARFPAELQLLHRDERGDGVTVSFFLEHAPKYMRGHYPGGCPSAYLAIEDETLCEDAALDMQVLHDKREAERSIVDFNNANARHRVSGCFAVKQVNESSPWRLSLDPQVMDLHFAHAAEPLCEFGGRTVLDWFEDLARLSTLPGGVLSCTGAARYFNPTCQKKPLRPEQFLQTEQRAMHYSADRTANMPECSVSVEWFVMPQPLPVRIEQIILAKAAYQTLIGEVLGMAEEQVLTHAGKVPKNDWKNKDTTVDLVTVLPPSEEFYSKASTFHLCVRLAAVFTALVAVALPILTCIAFRFQSEYEPDLCAMTARVCWPLVLEQSVIVVACLSGIPLFCSELRLKTDASAPPGGFLPWGCQIQLSAIIFTHIVAELYFFNCAGAAGRRVHLLEVFLFLFIDAFAIFDLYTDILFFVVAYLVGSPLCWGALGVLFGGLVVMQWFLGAMFCFTSPGQPLVHWYPRHMSLMHAVSLRQLHHMERWDLIRGIWVVLPLVKVLFEDIPQVCLQVAFGWRHDGDATLVVLVSLCSSAFFAIGGVICFAEQAVSLGIGVSELQDLFLECLGCRKPRARGILVPKRGPWMDPVPNGGHVSEEELLPPSRLTLRSFLPPTALARVYDENVDQNAETQDIKGDAYHTRMLAKARQGAGRIRTSLNAGRIGQFVNRRLSLPLTIETAAQPDAAYPDPSILTTLPPGVASDGDAERTGNGQGTRRVVKARMGSPGIAMVSFVPPPGGPPLERDMDIGSPPGSPGHQKSARKSARKPSRKQTLVASL